MSNLILPCDKYYNEARKVWNRIYEKYPLGIAYCGSYEDVKEAILLATKNNMKIRIRSGGHNYAGFSTGNETLIIDLSNLNKINIDYSCNTVTIDSGVYLGQLYNLVGSSDYPFPGGACPTVGATGFTLGGGWGYSCRYLGLGCDSLLEAKLIDYKGSIITANKTCNPDLFWALKGGGGGNFGVVISLTYTLPPKVDKITSFSFKYNNPSKEEQITFLNTWQNWLSTAPNNITMKGSIVNNSTSGIGILCTGILYGTPEELNKILYDFNKIPGFNLTSNYTSFLQGINTIGSVYPQYSYFETFSRFISKNLSFNTLSSLVDIINSTLPKGSTLIELNLFALGGKVREIEKNQTAFFYRDSKYILSIETVFKNNTHLHENKNWINKNASFIYDLGEGSYINFPYYPLPNYLHNYYGDNSYRLKCVQAKYDPYSIFNFPQSIQ